MGPAPRTSRGHILPATGADRLRHTERLVRVGHELYIGTNGLADGADPLDVPRDQTRTNAHFYCPKAASDEIGRFALQLVDGGRKPKPTACVDRHGGRGSSYSLVVQKSLVV
jgi:hypothetical protein